MSPVDEMALVGQELGDLNYPGKENPMPREVTPEVRAAAEAMAAAIDKHSHLLINRDDADRLDRAAYEELEAALKMWQDARGGDGESVRVPVELLTTAAVMLESAEDDQDRIPRNGGRIRYGHYAKQLRDLLAALGATTASADAERGERWRSL